MSAVHYCSPLLMQSTSRLVAGVAPVTLFIYISYAI